MKIKYQTERLWLNITYFLRPTFIANKCGHKTKIIGEIHYFNHTSIMEMELSKNGKPDYCLLCIAKMTIQCAWCGNPITIGSPITLFIPKKDFEIPNHTIAYQKDSLKKLVGCVHGNCIELPDDIQGYWMPPGKIIPSSLSYKI